MIEVAPDILYFERYLDRDFTSNVLTLLDEQNETMFNRELRASQFPFEQLKGRLELYNFPELMDEFNSFWYSKVEDTMLDYYMMHIDSDQVTEGYKKFARTEWKDLFIVHYLAQKGNNQNDIHIDFSGLTFIACLDDKYEGGELVFPKQNFEIKLGRRDLILFPGNFTHPHGVKPILSGDRKVVVGQSLGVKQLHKFGKEI